MTRVGPDWRRDDTCLGELDHNAGPFETSTYRQAFLATHAGWTDVSVGARIDDAWAAIGILARGGRGISVPYGYGGIRSDRRLTSSEASALLRSARRWAHLRSIEILDVPSLRESASPGRVVASTSLIQLVRGQAPAERFAKTARTAMRAAQRRGATAQPAASIDTFLRLYEIAAKRFRTRYPSALISRLVERGAARSYDVLLGGEPIASALALLGGGHSIYWLAAQGRRGRDEMAGYLAVAALLEDLGAIGQPVVNLGSSDGLPGVALFKSRIGGTDANVERAFVAGPLGMLEGAALVAWRSSRSVTRRLAYT